MTWEELHKLDSLKGLDNNISFEQRLALAVANCISMGEFVRLLILANGGNREASEAELEPLNKLSKRAEWLTKNVSADGIEAMAKTIILEEMY